MYFEISEKRGSRTLWCCFPRMNSSRFPPCRSWEVHWNSAAARSLFQGSKVRPRWGSSTACLYSLPIPSLSTGSHWTPSAGICQSRVDRHVGRWTSCSRRIGIGCWLHRRNDCWLYRCSHRSRVSVWVCSGVGREESVEGGCLKALGSLHWEQVREPLKLKDRWFLPL